MNFRNISAWSIRNPVIPLVAFTALLLAGPARVRDLFVEGRPVVRGGDLVSFDLAAALLRQNDLARRLMA